MLLEMDKASKNSSAYSWLTFLGILFLLIGIFASFRTVFNMVAFDKYPQMGVLPVSIFPEDSFYPREADCNYPAPYQALDTQPMTIESEPVSGSSTTTPDDKTVAVSSNEVEPQQKTFEQKQMEACLANIEESRKTTKVNDISKSLFFLFVGAGLLISRRKLFS